MMRETVYPPIIAAAKTWFKVSGMKITMTGTEYIPRDGGALIASNHIGYVDFIFNGFAAQPSKRFVRFMAKKDAFEHPISGPLMRGCRHIPVDRAAGEQSMIDAIEAIREGEIVGIFPEATISRSFEIKELKTGAVRIAAEAQAPLIPMVVWGTQLIKTKDHESSLLGRGKHIRIAAGEPMRVTGEDPVAETDELKKRLKALHDEVVSEYPVDPQGQWWAPARFGGTAPTPEKARELDSAELKARAERAKMKQ